MIGENNNNNNNDNDDDDDDDNEDEDENEDENETMTMTMTMTVATFLSFLLSLLFGALLRLFSDLRNHSFLHLYILFYGI